MGVLRFVRVVRGVREFRVVFREAFYFRDGKRW